jgi:D-glycero-D-manno-heptose 1,7-bisphosphate phosphatase
MLKIKKYNEKNIGIFLDRDGVINETPGLGNYVYKIKDFKILPGVFDALKLFQLKGYKLFIITNQSGIGKGIYTKEEFLKVNKYMLNIFKEQRINIEKVYFCPHKPEENCECRKPKTKFINQAVKDFNLDLNQSWVIGDMISDIQMGKNAGCNTILIDSEFVKCFKQDKCLNLSEAVKLILG